MSPGEHNTVNSAAVDLRGKTAIVTGSSRGIGKAIALGLAARGAAVAVCGRASSNTAAALSIEATVASIREAGGEAESFACDVTKAEDVRTLVRNVVDRFGGVDALVNNAGTLWRFGLLETPHEKWNEIIRTNLDGVYLCTMEVIPLMQRNGWGSIVNITSGRAHSDDGISTAYAASKAAVDRLTIKLAAEVKEFGIAVNALEPGQTLTELPSGLPPGWDRSGWVPPEAKRIIPATSFLVSQNALTGQSCRRPSLGTTGRRRSLYGFERSPFSYVSRTFGRVLAVAAIGRRPYTVALGRSTSGRA